MSHCISYRIQILHLVEILMECFDNDDESGLVVDGCDERRCWNDNYSRMKKMIGYNVTPSDC